MTSLTQDPTLATHHPQNLLNGAQETSLGNDQERPPNLRLKRMIAAVAVALAAAIPLSVAISNVLIGLLVFLWLSSGGVLPACRRAWAHPVARAALILLAVLAAGTLYGTGTIAQRWNMLGKYVDLLLLVPLLQVFAERPARRAAAFALLAAMALTLALSCLIAVGWLPQNPWLKATPGDASVFKDHITQSILMAFAAFTWASEALHGDRRWRRVGAGMMALLAVVDIFFLVEGRTGYLVVAVLAVYLSASRFSRRGIVIGILAVCALTASAYRYAPAFRMRVDQAVQELSHWQPNRAHKTPVGLRLDYYENSVRIIARHPLLGVGTGGFASAYAREAARFHMETTSNPHNQFLLVAIETGMPGLVALIALFAIQWLTAARLSAPQQRVARALLLTMIVGCLLNSLLIDYTERLFYVLGTALLYARIDRRVA